MEQLLQFLKHQDPERPVMGIDPNGYLMTILSVTDDPHTETVWLKMRDY